MTITQEICLDISYENTYKTILAKQYDENSRFLKVTLTSMGEMITVDSNHVAILNICRADKEAQSFAGVVNTDGTVTVPFPNWMLQVEGEAKCNVSIFGHNDTKLSSLNFNVVVEKGIRKETDITEDENYDVLVSLISRVITLSAEMDAAEAQREVGEQRRNNAETERQAQFAESIADAEEATQNANNAAQQAASAILAGGFLPIYDEDKDKNYNWQIIIRDGHPVLTLTEITE